MKGAATLSGSCPFDRPETNLDEIDSMSISSVRDDEDSERHRTSQPHPLNSVGTYLHQIAHVKLLSKEEERMWFQIIDASSAKVSEIFSRFLFASGMYIRELQRLAAGDRHFDSIVSESVGMRCAAYKKAIPELCRCLADASDKLSGAEALSRSLGSNPVATDMLNMAREEIQRQMQRLSFRQSVVEAFCDIAYEDIYSPYMDCRKRLSSGTLTEGIAEKIAAFESEFGMSPEEFIASFDEMREVLKVIQAARTKIVESNMRLVVHVAKKYINRGIELSDLLQDGSIGLMTAVRKFDRLRGHKFSTYATWWIRQTISRSLTNNSRTIRVPAHMVDMLNKMNSVEKTLTQELGRVPSIDEVADKMKKDVEKIQQLRELRQQTVSLDCAVSEDNDTTIGELVKDETIEDPIVSVERHMVQEKVREALSMLSEREQVVIDLRFGLSDGNGHTLDEIGRIFNVTREHIRQIEINAIEKLKQFNGLKALAELIV